MRQNIDDVRHILLEVESHYFAFDCEIEHDEPRDKIAFRKVTLHSLEYHLPLLFEAGLLRGGVEQNKAGAHFHSVDLTWEGHNLLNNIRNEGVMAKVRATLASEELQSASVSVWAAVASDIIKRNLGIGQ